MNAKSNEELLLEARTLCTVADEILHRGGPAAFIETVMSCAANAERAGYHDCALSDCDSAEREFQASQAPKAKRALAAGYRELIQICGKRWWDCNAPRHASCYRTRLQKLGEEAD